ELCASAGIGVQATSTAATARWRSVERMTAKCMAASLRLAPAVRARGHTRRDLSAPRLELLAFRRARRSKAEAVEDKGVVVLFLALLVGPVVRAHPRLDDELIALTRVPGDRFTQRAECDEPQGGNDLARSTLFVFAGVIVAHQAEARVADVVLGRQFRVARQIADRSQREAVHRDCSLLPSVGSGKVGSQSIQAAVDWNRDSPSVCAEMRNTQRTVAPARPGSCMVAASARQWEE